MKKLILVIAILITAISKGQEIKITEAPIYEYGYSKLEQNDGNLTFRFDNESFENSRYIYYKSIHFKDVDEAIIFFETFVKISEMKPKKGQPIYSDISNARIYNNSGNYKTQIQAKGGYTEMSTKTARKFIKALKQYT